MVVSAFTNLFKPQGGVKGQLVFGGFYTISGSFWQVFGEGREVRNIINQFGKYRQFIKTRYLKDYTHFGIDASIASIPKKIL